MSIIYNYNKLKHNFMTNLFKVQIEDAKTGNIVHFYIDDINPLLYEKFFNKKVTIHNGSEITLREKVFKKLFKPTKSFLRTKDKSAELKYETYKEYNKKNEDRIKKYYKNYYKKNREKIKVDHKQWYEKNKDIIKQRYYANKKIISDHYNK